MPRYHSEFRIVQDSNHTDSHGYEFKLEQRLYREDREPREGYWDNCAWLTPESVKRLVAACQKFVVEQANAS